MTKTFLRHTFTENIFDIVPTYTKSVSLYIFTIWKCIFYHCICRDRIYSE